MASRSVARTSASDLELIYALSRHPQEKSTFVNGEAAILAEHVGSLRIVAEKRSPEPELRPGGIPPDVDVAWTPKRAQSGFWRGTLAHLGRRPRRYLSEIRTIATPAVGFTARRRWAYSAMAAAAYAAELPRWSGRRHLHAHFAATGAVLAHVVARMTGSPYSVTVHGSADLFRENPHLDLLLNDASLIVPVSSYHRDVILDRLPHVDPARIAVIHIGVRSAALAAAGRAQPAHSRHDPPRLVSVANLVPMKGMPILIRAIARLARSSRPVRLDVIGDGPQRRELEDEIRRLGVEDLVRILGAAPPEAAHEAMRQADLFTLACIKAPDGSQDGVPTVLMEAMASGRPVVSTRLSGIPELIEDGVTGWLTPPGDDEAFAAAIADALDHPDEAARRARAGQEHVMHTFDQERNALTLLDRILAIRPQNASR